MSAQFCPYSYSCWGQNEHCKKMSAQFWRLLQLKWTLTLWNWDGCSHAVSSRFQVFNITCIALWAKQWTLDLNMKCKQTLKHLFLSLLMTRACGRKARLKDFLANQNMGLSTFNFSSFFLFFFFSWWRFFFFIYSFGHVLFQFLCNLQQYCDSAYNKLNSHQQKEFINTTKMNYIGKE